MAANKDAQKYVVYDLQGCGFMSWTKKEPQTAAELLEIFQTIADNEEHETIPETLDDIREVWELDIIPVEQTDKYERGKYVQQ